MIYPFNKTPIKINKENVQPNKRPMERWNNRASVDSVHYENSFIVHARIHELKTEHHPQFFVNCMLSASGGEPLYHYFLFEVKSLKE